MTRRDDERATAAMTLALGLLRAGRVGLHAVDREALAVGQVDAATNALCAYGFWWWPPRPWPSWLRTRLVRARLALLLRATLRAEAIDRYDPWEDAPDPRPRLVCSGCRVAVSRCYQAGALIADEPCPSGATETRAVWPRPLWERP